MVTAPPKPEAPKLPLRRRPVAFALEFMRIEAAGGIAMLVAAAVALIWANSAWPESYVDFWESVPGTLGLAGFSDLHLTLGEWVSDGAMALFFLLVALELKRERIEGGLRDNRSAALPALAALGGMIVPAVIYAAFNAGTAGSDGWGIPMATDIAFAAGVVSLLGRRVPAGARLFLLTLAVVDDLGAIVVIAVFYSTSLSFGWLVTALAAVAVAFVLRRRGVHSLPVHIALGLVCWVALHHSGVHATLAGVAFGFLVPASGGDPDRDPPLQRLSQTLHPWVTFVVVPIFALASAGVAVSGGALGDALDGRIAIGVAVGLVVGKAFGVLGAAWLACKVGLGRLPDLATWRHMLGIAVCAGIGFTVALLVAGLSFTDPELVDQAKIGILVASLIAGVVGALLLGSGPMGTLLEETAEEPAG
jgi:Na+:H+ antiporter, NhaA family